MLSDEDFRTAAGELNCDVAAIRAVVEVEAAGAGFLADGRPKILFEAHVFHRLTAGQHLSARDRGGVPLSSQSWDRSLYGAGGAHQHERLADAAQLDHAAAHKACSWGAFQIMGENHAACGYPDVEGFVEAMDSESSQLAAFVAFLKSTRLDAPLRRHDWPAFARGYNGPSYRTNRYDEKLAAAYGRWSTAV